jgi:penicillin-binding protein 2
MHYHKTVDVFSAISQSCNYFFFDTGRQVGITKLNDYAKKFGLGQKTGIEISGEAQGVLAGPEYRKSIDAVWYPGDTIQAAIGQLDNMFTPLQMANYIATVANGGTRYAPHLVKSIVSPDGLETVVSFEPKILNTVDINPENLKLVHAGMRSVVETTSKTSFETAKYNSAGKTGTAQTSLTKTPHSSFVSFAPAEKPQVAIAVVVEHGGINGLGGHVSLVARKMFDAYFFSNQSDSFSMKNTLIN